MTIACSPGTFFEVASPSVTRGSPQTYFVTFDIPTTGDACDRLLTTARQHMRVPEQQRAVAKELARFLGANSSVWTLQRRTELRHLLASSDAGLDAVLEVVADRCRADVADAAEVVLVDMLDRSSIHLSALTMRYGRLASSAARASIVRALGNSRFAKEAALVLIAALADDDAEVRDAAASALADVGGASVEVALRHRLAHEDNSVVRGSLQAALDDLSAG